METWPPAPPEGYRLHEPDDEQPWYVTAFLYVWIVGVFIGVPVLVIVLKGYETAIRLAYVVFQDENLGKWIVYLLWVIGMISVYAIVHEGIHALCGWWFGYRSKFGIEYTNPLNVAPTTLTYGGFQSRGESLAIALVPLVVLTPASLLVLVVDALEASRGRTYRSQQAWTAAILLAEDMKTLPATPRVFPHSPLNALYRWQPFSPQSYSMLRGISRPSDQ